MGKKTSANVLHTVVFSLHGHVKIQLLVPEGLWELKLSHFALIYQPLCRILLVVDLNREDFALIDKQGLIPPSYAISSHKHASFSSSVIESPKTNRFCLIIVATVSLSDTILVDETYADGVFASILH